ncbi:MAG: ABC transporter permease [Candidatus Marsarchaeota archaeon]|jgi:ABC-2 type transport system permease protein|nr:ABC transporter permease [Candidatus Marsarchaeota archaeon]
MSHFWKDSIALYIREMQIFRSHLRTNIIRSIIFPLTFILLLGNLGSMSAAKTNIAIVNYAQNPLSYQFISDVTASHSLNIVAQTNQYEALKMLSNGNATLVMVVLPSFPYGSPSIYIYYDNNPIELGSSLQVIQSLTQQFGATASAVSSSSSTGTTSIFINPTYATSASYKTFLIGGIIVMVAVFGTLFGGGLSLISDKQLGNLKSFLITPIDRKSIIMSKIFYSITLAMLNATIALIIGVLDGGGIAMGLFGLVWIYGLVLFVAIGFSGLTLLLASRIDKQEVYTIVSNALIMPLWFISGAFFPTSALPSWLYPISVINPLTYATNGMRYVMMNGYYPLNLVIFDFSILIVFAIIMVVLAINSLKRTIA